MESSSKYLPENQSRGEIELLLPVGCSKSLIRLWTE